MKMITSFQIKTESLRYQALHAFINIVALPMFYYWTRPSAMNRTSCYTHGQSDPFPTQRDICYQPNWPHFILICTKWIILIKRLNSLSLSIQSNRCCLFYVITSVINPDHVWHIFLGSMVLTQFFMIFFIVNILNINMKVFKIIYILCILPASIYYLALFR